MAMKYLKDIKRERKVFNGTLTVDTGTSESVVIQLPIKVLRESGKPTSAKKRWWTDQISHKKSLDSFRLFIKKNTLKIYKIGSRRFPCEKVQAVFGGQ